MDHPLVFLDTETAAPPGSGCGAPHLVELGAVRVRGGESTDSFQSLVRPAVPIAPEASAVHGLAEADVADAPEAAEVLARFRDWVGADWLVGHDAPRDQHVLAFEYARHGLEAPPGPLLCTLRWSRRHLPEAPDHRLATLVEHLGIEGALEHRALPDAVHCWQIFEACVRRLGGWESLGEAELLRHASLPGTLLSAAPRLPRRHQAHVHRLEAARREHAAVEILYGDPRDASVSRLPVLPRLVYQWKDKAYLEGECRRSGLLKTYRLDRVRRVEAARD